MCKLCAVRPGVPRHRYSVFLGAMLAASLFCPLRGTAQLSQSNGTGSISGRVLNSLTGEPLSKADVRLYGARPSTSEGPRTFSVRTAADGAFSIKDLPAGEYVVGVSRRSFAAQAAEIKGLPGARRQGRGVLASVQAGQQIRGVEILIPPASVITGKVVDEEGEPMAGVLIEVEQYRYIRGKKVLSPTGRDSSDDRGMYRIFDLPAGRYFVKAQGRSLRARFGAAMMGPGPRPGMLAAVGEGSAYPETYYPNAPGAAEAIPLQLSPGAEMGGIDFVLTPRPTYSISGVVSGGTAERGLMVTAIDSAGNIGMGGAASMSPANPNTGEFTLRNLSPGSYDVVARSNIRPRGPRNAANGDPPSSMGVARVDLGNSSVDGVSIMLQEDVTVSGTVKLPEGVSTDQLARLTITPERRFNPGRGTARADANGGFRLSLSPVDTTSFSISGVPDGLYVKRLMLGSTNLLDSAPGGFLDAASSMTIELGEDGGVVKGFVRDAQGSAVTGSRVTLLPVREGIAREIWRKTQTSSEDGSFEFESVAPGTYRLYSFEELDADPSFDLDFLSNFGQRWVEVDVKPRVTKVAEPKLIPASDTALYLNEVP